MFQQPQGIQDVKQFEGTYEDLYKEETLYMFILSKGILLGRQSEKTYKRTYWQQTLQVFSLW